MMNSIPLSIRTIYHYSKFSLGVTPRGDPTLTPKWREIIEKESPVPIERIIVCRATGRQVRSIVGKWPFVILGMNDDDLKYYLRKLRVASIEGRLPRGKEPEALISEPVARNLNLKLGDTLIGKEDSDNFSPMNVKVVGIARSDEWIMAAPIEYLRENHFPPIDALMVLARNLDDQAALDRWATKRFKGERAQIFAYFELEKDTDEMFQTLYKVLNVVIGTLVFVITLVVGLLINIYQLQRTQEYGLLQALGFTKKQLVLRALFESTAVVIVGWILGVLLSVGLLTVVKAQLMDPNAYALNPLDVDAVLHTLPVPIAIFVAAVITIGLKFRKFDPVGVVERRIV